jgi:hypothetical protein
MPISSSVLLRWPKPPCSNNEKNDVRASAFPFADAASNRKRSARIAEFEPLPLEHLFPLLLPLLLLPLMLPSRCTREATGGGAEPIHRSLVGSSPGECLGRAAVALEKVFG